MLLNGLLRNIDSKWSKQYKGLFCVLNSFGQVLTWKLTKHLTFDEAESQMQLLQSRLSAQGCQIQGFYICGQLLFLEKQTANRIWSHVESIS